MEAPESKGLFVMLLAAKLTDAIIREIITISRGDTFTSAVASLVVFGFSITLIFGVLALSYFIYLWTVKAHCTKYVSSIVQVVGVVLYFYGDTLPYILRTYGDVLGCDSTCVRNNTIAAIVALTLALIIFHFSPSILHKVYQLLDKKDEKTAQSPWFFAVAMFAVLLKMDTIYSSVSAIVESEEFCNHDNNIASDALIVMCILCGMAAVLLHGVHAIHVHKNKSDQLYTGLTILTIILLMLCFPLFMIGDNREPLDCALMTCDGSAALNLTSSCDERVVLNSGIRIGFLSSVLLIITSLSVFFFGCVRTKDKEQLMYSV